MDCKCETCVRKDCPDRTRQDDLRIIIVCDDYMEQERKMTNADRIRAMSDEELAKFLTNPCECTVDPTVDGYRECGNKLCIQYLLEWLKQPAEESDNK